MSNINIQYIAGLARYWQPGTQTVIPLAHSKTGACMLSSFSHVQLSATLWTVAHQAPLSIGFWEARTLEWVAMPSSRGSSWPQDQIHISCLLHWQLGSFPLAPPEKFHMRLEMFTKFTLVIISWCMLSEIIMLYTFNLYSAACQLCLNTARRKESIDKLKKQLKCLFYRNRQRWNVTG